MAYTKVPLQNVAAVDLATGKFVIDWYDVFRQLDGLSPISGSVTATFGVAALTPGNTTVSVSTGAISDSGNNGVGVVHNFIGYNSSGTTAAVLQTLYDSFSTIASYINGIRTDLTADQTAVAALNTRLTVLENKVNAVIADLTARFP